jgi:hypothetical protein
MRFSTFTFLVAAASAWYFLNRFLDAQETSGYSSGGEQSDLQRALNEDRGRMSMAQGARGKPVDVDDTGGGHTRRTVGRGVIKNR